MITLRIRKGNILLNLKNFSLKIMRKAEILKKINKKSLEFKKLQNLNFGFGILLLDYLNKGVQTLDSSTCIYKTPSKTQ